MNLTLEDLNTLAKMLADETEKRCSVLASESLLAAAVRQLGSDRHDWGDRPCSTCAQITKALGEPFGCDKVRREREQNARTRSGS